MESLAVNGSYLAYAWLMLLQVSIVYLQRPDMYRRLGKDSGVPNFYAVATGLLGTALNWVSWLLSAWVANRFGIPAGVLFFCLGMGTSVLANILMPRIPRADRVAHFASIPLTLLLTRAVLRESGVDTGF